MTSFIIEVFNVFFFVVEQSNQTKRIQRKTNCFLQNILDYFNYFVDRLFMASTPTSFIIEQCYRRMQEEEEEEENERSHRTNHSFVFKLN